MYGINLKVGFLFRKVVREGAGSAKNIIMM